MVYLPMTLLNMCMGIANEHGTSSMKGDVFAFLEMAYLHDKKSLKSSQEDVFTRSDCMT